MITDLNEDVFRFQSFMPTLFVIWNLWNVNAWDHRYSLNHNEFRKTVEALKIWNFIRFFMSTLNL